MKLHQIAPNPKSKKRRRRIGRGISAGQGASGGFGMRGQKSRSGTGTKPGFEGGQMPLYRRVPKLKHFKIINPKHFTIINVEKLANLAPNTEVTLESLMEHGIVTANDGPLKILGNGELNVALNVNAAAWSKSAQAKIEAAGGSITSTTPKTESGNND
ncbi:50S ribosomal protein L15 [Cyanobacterium aponinum FACHB-4101]|uniref:50S ribosomal protein L15 n=1 Tax=Cyanobacterium aponinum TaxID=379064 RepID=UPI00168102D3|nr:50S ribosomal protein L15 [Cyanobacterium aponinum]MBD2395058.1 50S ribosomal protein L15 [Cyanobacterium aponinum FACHB-4101]